MRAIDPDRIQIILATDCGSTTTKAILIQRIDGIYRQTRTGRPCGAAGLMVRVDNLQGRVVSPAKRGRKPRDRKVQQGRNEK